MDPELRTLITPHINAAMQWQDLIDMVMKFDEARRHSKHTRNSYNYQRNRQNNFKSYGQNNTRSYNSNQNNNKKPWNKGRANNSNWKPKSNWSPKTTYNKNANKSRRDISTVKCFNCNEMGHYANKCPSLKKSLTSAAQQVRLKPTYLRKPAIRTAATRIKMPQVDQPKGLIDNSSNHMLINIKVDKHLARALIDQQTTGASLISTTFASTYNLPTVALTNEITVNLALQGSRGKSTHYVRSTLEIGGHMIDVYLCVVALADWDLILGEPILRMMQTIIDITNQMFTIQPRSTDRPFTLSAIPNKAPRRQLVLATAVPIAVSDVIPQ